MDLPVLISVPIILFFGLAGYRDGVVKRIVEIVGALAALLLTARFAEWVAPWVSEHTDLGETAAMVITWAGLFFAGLILSRLLANLSAKLLRLTILGWLDRVGGLVLGLAMGTLVASVIMLAATQAPGGEAIKEAYDRQAFGRFVYYAAPSFYEQARRLVGGKLDEVWDNVFDKAADTADRVKDKVADEVEERTGDG